ncbi:MAG: extracellular solute-binding protein [Planctomycetota bacterium]
MQIGCMKQSDREVIVYSALDREFSEPVLKELSEELGLDIRPKFDLESNKSVGLANEIIQKKNRPPADIFWNNEILHTFRLQQAGMLEIYTSPQADRFPEKFQSATGHWHGFAARSRVLIVNTNRLPDADARPDSIYDLADPKWKGQCAIARPVFGTTATHAAVLLATVDDGKSLLNKIFDNAVMVGGNKQVAQKVASGEFAFGITDTDDAMIELDKAQPVAMIFPDQGADQMGTLVIPNTLAIIKNGPNTQRAKQLVDRLLQADIEIRLAKGASAQLPLANDIDQPWRVFKHSSLVTRKDELRWMRVDFAKAAESWDAQKEFLANLGK